MPFRTLSLAALAALLEPTGCLAAAAVLEGALDGIRGQRIGIILSGGNVDLPRFASLIAE